MLAAGVIFVTVGAIVTAIGLAVPGYSLGQLDHAHAVLTGTLYHLDVDTGHNLLLRRFVRRPSLAPRRPGRKRIGAAVTRP